MRIESNLSNLLVMQSKKFGIPIITEAIYRRPTRWIVVTFRVRKEVDSKLYTVLFTLYHRTPRQEVRCLL